MGAVEVRFQNFAEAKILHVILKFRSRVLSHSKGSPSRSLRYWMGAVENLFQNFAGAKNFECDLRIPKLIPIAYQRAPIPILTAQNWPHKKPPSKNKTKTEQILVGFLQRRLLWFIYGMREAVPRPRVGGPRARLWEGRPLEGRPWEGRLWEGRPWEGPDPGSARIRLEFL